ncbi:2Fe-2S ferredoxin-like protein [Aestuariibacter halophilus]|uniref:2Fe-2S ferredoxin-like protein n=1 Tax=Fluctibacter halophilus TaxID=226011 RepID=A0ABS8G515_9ALTE|nr:class I ribonucleotide reductase maintenance protein YfaE [Aestuariibacter halophilus]MCC2615598.1 2Fe-2S ferredoxin-like protein [Aestuariibacter halophilus]
MSGDDNRIMIEVIDHDPVPSLDDKTVLESLEAAGINLQYHCRDGFCGACRTKLLDGDVDYTTDPLAFIDDDEILPCCCKAKTSLKLKAGL